MKPIRSNHNGKRIHSPFVYQLVTQVIAAKNSRETLKWIENLGLTFINEQRVLLVFRLLSFFRPAQIRFFGKSDIRFETMYAQACSTAIIQSFSAEGKLLLNENNEVVIFYELPAEMPEIPDNYNDAVWILQAMDTTDLQNFLRQCKENGKVKVTLDLNHSGIIIFNRKLQKENFVIITGFFYQWKRRITNWKR